MGRGARQKPLSTSLFSSRPSEPLGLNAVSDKTDTETGNLDIEALRKLREGAELFAIVAEVEDASRFEEKFDYEAPVECASGYDSSKSPTENIIEFYVRAIDENDALTQFKEACNFVGQRYKDITVSSM